MPIDIRLPNIGDFTDVEVVEVHVSSGSRVAVDEPLITLESDKASMEIPAEQAGTVTGVLVQPGDRLSEGDVICRLEPQDDGAGDRGASAAAEDSTGQQATATAAVAQEPGGAADATVLVLGSGPGGYTAAFRAADLGMKAVLVERYPDLGGVCLNVGCIPSKALLHAAKVINEAAGAVDFGINFARPDIDIDKLRGWKNGVLGQLTGGLAKLAKQRKVEVIQGVGTFKSANELTVSGPDGERVIAFAQAIIAAGSEAAMIPGLPDDPRIMTSTGALQLDDIPARLLVIGGGIIGLEMACVYHELGSKVTVVELLDELMAGADPDIVKPLQRRISKQYENIFLGTAVDTVKAQKKGLKVSFKGDKAPAEDTFDRVLVAVGRRPNGKAINAAAAGVEVNEQGFIPVDEQQRSNVPHIFAIGDITGQPMLAHKAVHEGKVAAEVAAGEKSAFIARVIPSVAYTDPEVAWVGVTETQAKEQGIDYGKGVFPWAASGRSLSLGRNEGMTKLLFDNKSRRVIGAGIVGTNAGDLIAEVGLAIEMGCVAEDISLTIHPHPTLSETVAFAAEMFEGTITDLYVPRKK